MTGSLCLKGALDNPILYLPVAVGFVSAFVILAAILRRGMALGVAYGIWSASGVVLTAALSAVIYDEPFTFVMGTGIALTWAPTTESIMGSLPPAKAGIGSAVNDTVREIGGALGVAVLGSVLASRYAASVRPVTAGLPQPAAQAANDSLGGALLVARQVGGRTGSALVEAARDAYVQGFGVALVVAAAVALAGAAVAALWLPSRASDASAIDVDLAAAEPEGELVAA